MIFLFVYFIHDRIKIPFFLDEKPYIVVPYKVLMELDKLKLVVKAKLGSLKTDKQVYTNEGRNEWKELNTSLHRITRANHSINGWNQTHPKQFLGQSAVQHYEHLQMVTIINGDDEILNFSHQLRRKCDQSAHVIILSNDLNFRNRANASFMKTPDIPAYTPLLIVNKLDEIYNDG